MPDLLLPSPLISPCATLYLLYRRPCTESREGPALQADRPAQLWVRSSARSDHALFQSRQSPTQTSWMLPRYRISRPEAKRHATQTPSTHFIISKFTSMGASRWKMHMWWAEEATTTSTTNSKLTTAYATVVPALIGLPRKTKHQKMLYSRTDRAFNLVRMWKVLLSYLHSKLPAWLVTSSSAIPSTLLISFLGFEGPKLDPGMSLCSATATILCSLVSATSQSVSFSSHSVLTLEPWSSLHRNSRTSKETTRIQKAPLLERRSKVKPTIKLQAAQEMQLFSWA